MTDRPLIDVQGVTKTLRRRRVLDGVSLTIRRGGIYAIQGANGSGKSVLLRVMTRLMRPDEGQVLIADDFLPPGRSYPDRFGILIDRPGFVGNQTGLENLQALARIQGRVGDAEILDWMDRLGLDPGLPQKMKAYSQGMIQKVGLIQAVMEEQQVLILDEPFTALDEDTVAEVYEILLELVAAGRTLVFTTHDRDHVQALGAERYLMVDGVLSRRSI